MLYRCLLVLFSLSVNVQSNNETGLSELDTYIRNIRDKLQAFEEADEANEGIHDALRKALKKKLQQRESYSLPSPTKSQSVWLDQSDIESMRRAAQSGPVSVDQSNTAEKSTHTPPVDLAGSGTPQALGAKQASRPHVSERATAALGEADQKELGHIWHELLAMKTMQAELHAAVFEKTAGVEVRLGPMSAAEEAVTDCIEESHKTKPHVREGILIGDESDEPSLIEQDEKDAYISLGTPLSAKGVVVSSRRENLRKDENKWLKEYEALRAKMDG